jgi:hypothetical protein
MPYSRYTTALTLSTCCFFLLVSATVAQQIPAPNPEKPTPVCDFERALALLSDQLDEIKAVEPKW